MLSQSGTHIIRDTFNSLEKVQKFALKVCTGKWNTDYDSLLNFCKLPSLVSRRHYLKLSQAALLFVDVPFPQT